MDSLPINLADLIVIVVLLVSGVFAFVRGFVHEVLAIASWVGAAFVTLYAYPLVQPWVLRSEEHTSELQSLMRISYAVFCLKKTSLDSPPLVSSLLSPTIY